MASESVARSPSSSLARTDEYLLKSLHFKSFCPTQGCTKPCPGAASGRHTAPPPPLLPRPSQGIIESIEDEFWLSSAVLFPCLDVRSGVPNWISTLALAAPGPQFRPFLAGHLIRLFGRRGVRFCHAANISMYKGVNGSFINIRRTVKPYGILYPDTACGMCMYRDPRDRSPLRPVKTRNQAYAISGSAKPNHGGAALVAGLGGRRKPCGMPLCAPSSQGTRTRAATPACCLARGAPVVAPGLAAPVTLGASVAYGGALGATATPPGSSTT